MFLIWLFWLFLKIIANKFMCQKLFRMNLSLNLTFKGIVSFRITFDDFRKGRMTSPCSLFVDSKQRIVLLNTGEPKVQVAHLIYSDQYYHCIQRQYNITCSFMRNSVAIGLRSSMHIWDAISIHIMFQDVGLIAWGSTAPRGGTPPSHPKRPGSIRVNVIKAWLRRD